MAMLTRHSLLVLSPRLEAELAAAANQPLPDDEDELLDS